ncbi:MAG: hypothetical protein U0350_39995 [Caldilineaceae bacterium]
MFEHLWTDGPTPIEYVELKLGERFSCLPSALRRESAADILQILTMIDVEAKVRAKRNS